MRFLNVDHVYPCVPSLAEGKRNLCEEVGPIRVVHRLPDEVRRTHSGGESIPIKHGESWQQSASDI